MKVNHKKEMKELYKNRVLTGGIYTIKCNENQYLWVRSSANIQSVRNRFDFFVSANICPEPCMGKLWNQFGPTSFSFEILEEIQKKETQTEQEFLDSIQASLELWIEEITVKATQYQIANKEGE